MKEHTLYLAAALGLLASPSLADSCAHTVSHPVHGTLCVDKPIVPPTREQCRADSVACEAAHKAYATLDRIRAACFDHNGKRTDSEAVANCQNVWTPK
jgi:hypothetical protein